MYELELDEGKYKIIYNQNPYQFKALRYGKEWRDLIGDNLILALVNEIDKLNAEIGELSFKVFTGSDM